MNDHCTFCKEHKCIKWADYELLRYELEEANEVYDLYYSIYYFGTAYYMFYGSLCVCTFEL